MGSKDRAGVFTGRMCATRQGERSGVSSRRVSHGHEATIGDAESVILTGVFTSDEPCFTGERSRTALRRCLYTADSPKVNADETVPRGWVTVLSS
jgi:hypothetical protein